MAFGAHKKYPLDTKPSIAIGIGLPFNDSAVFKSTFLTKDAIKTNLLNYFLTNKNERYLNGGFGANLYGFLFEQITNGDLSTLKDNIQSKINQLFTNINLKDIIIDQFEGVENAIKVEIFYSVKNTNIEDKIEITF